jgi:hypothetical protein
MLRKLKQHVTYANIMASLAVFVVLGGGMAVAAGLKKNSVGKKQIKAGAVVSKKIADGAITTNDLADNAVTGDKADESSFGQVPSAASAETADSATTANSAETAETAETATTATNATNATNAQKAQTATNATSAQNANLAANATLFDGNSVGEVRSTLQDDNVTVDDQLTIVEEQIDGLNVNTPAGDGNVFATATVVLTNNGVQAAPQCRLRLDGGAFSQQSLDTMPAGHSRSVTLVGMVSDNGGQVTVHCAGGSAGDNDVRVIQGDLVVSKAPTG